MLTPAVLGQGYNIVQLCEKKQKSNNFFSIFKQDLWQMSGGLEQQAKTAPLSFFA